MYQSLHVVSFMKEQRERADRQWVSNVLLGTQETESVKVRTGDFVILPDVACEWPKQRPQHVGSGSRYEWSPSHGKGGVYSYRKAQTGKLNWLSIMTDPSLRTLRDLRGVHVPMLQDLKARCLEAVQNYFNVEISEIMIFANYPPSVYTLHFHICCPFRVAAPFDAFRMHSLESIIQHLEVDPEYYCKYSLHIPVSNSSRLYHALMGTRSDDSKGASEETNLLLKKCFQGWRMMFRGSNQE